MSETTASTRRDFIKASSTAVAGAAVLNTLARGARHLDSNADKAPPGLPRITAWAGASVAALTLQGGMSRLSRSESGLMRSLAGAQFEDGGLMSRSPQEQLLLVDRLGLVRAAYFAAKQSLPDTIEAAVQEKSRNAAQKTPVRWSPRLVAIFSDQGAYWAAPTTPSRIRPLPSKIHGPFGNAQ